MRFAYMALVVSLLVITLPISAQARTRTFKIETGDGKFVEVLLEQRRGYVISPTGERTERAMCPSSTRAGASNPNTERSS